MKSSEPTQSYTFDCGCSFPILDPTLDAGGLPLLDFDEKYFKEECPRVWKLLGEGHTTGVFQLESVLGHNWSRRLAPEQVDHLAALAALLRPGTLNAKDEQGVSMTEHFVLRKNGKEESIPIHPAITKQLEDTYQVLTYQEQSIQIVSDVGGFTPEEADILRRAMGKKDSRLMHECSVKFTEGAMKNGLSKDDADFIFGLIRAGEKYNFNKAHSYGYGKMTFTTAYAKAHFPVQFFRSWLAFSRGSTKWDQKVKELVEDAICFGVDIKCPDLRMKKRGYYTDGKNIWCGLSSIKGVGGASYDKIATTLHAAELKYGPVAKWTWLDLLFGLLCKTNKTASEGLIYSGACDFVKLSRTKMQYEFNKLSDVVKTNKEMLNEIIECYDGQPALADVLEFYANSGRGQDARLRARREKMIAAADFLRNPGISLVDTLQSKHSREQYYLAVALSVSHIDRAANKRLGTKAGKDFTCRNLAMNEKVDKVGYVLALVKEVKAFFVKKGKNEGRGMGNVFISDNTGNAKLVLFPDDWAKFSDKLHANRIYRFGVKQFNDAYLVCDVEEYDVNPAESGIQNKINTMLEDATLEEMEIV